MSSTQPRTSTYYHEIEEWRVQRDEFFGSHYASPLADDVMSSFDGLSYFDVDPSLVFEVDLHPADDDLEITSSTGGSSRYPVAGVVMVPFSAKTMSLVVLNGEEGEMFIPFRDATSGFGSYAGGRYASVEPAPDGRLVVDFNRSINPYCAYDEDFSCPLPPAQNWIDDPIEAGEKDY